MLSKVIFAIVFTLTSLALGAEIMLNQEADVAATRLESDGDSKIGSVADLATSNSDLSKSTEEDSSSDELDEWSTMTDASVTENIAEPPMRRRPMSKMRPMMRRMAVNARLDYASEPQAEGRFQLMNLIDRLRQADGHEEPGGWPHMMPQNQLVDSTIRLMAIKSSLDDLLMGVFPNLRMLQRMFMERE